MNKTTKLYKFRPLANELDFYRLKEILETGKFWCSRFWELNDPMEALFSGNKWKETVREIFNGKKSYKICSFSGEEALKEPKMWTHYSNGFKGVAIEIEVKGELKKYSKEDNLNEGKKAQIYEIDYNDEPPDGSDVLEILTRKNKVWKDEYEYRFLKKERGREASFKVGGEITTIYCGNPYGNIGNQEDILKNCVALSRYRGWIKKIKEGIESKDVYMENGVVIIK